MFISSLRHGNITSHCEQFSLLAKVCPYLMWEKKIMKSSYDSCLQIFEVLSCGEGITVSQRCSRGSWLEPKGNNYEEGDFSFMWERALSPRGLAALWGSKPPITSSVQAELGGHVWRNNPAQISSCPPPPLDTSICAGMGNRKTFWGKGEAIDKAQRWCLGQRILTSFSGSPSGIILPIVHSDFTSVEGKRWGYNHSNPIEKEACKTHQG